MGDEAEITAPKPLSLLRRPPGCAREESFSTGFVWWDFKPYGCCGGKERCKAWCPSSMAGLSGAFYTSPSPTRQVCPQGQPGCATGASWGQEVRSWLGGAGGFQGTCGSFVPSGAEISGCGCFLAFLCSCCCKGVTWGQPEFGGVSGGWQMPRTISQDAGAHVPAGLPAVASKFLSGRSIVTPPIGAILGTGACSACVQTHKMLTPSPSVRVASHDASPCILPHAPFIPLRRTFAPLPQGLVLATHAGRSRGFWSQNLGSFRGPFGPWWLLGIASGSFTGQVEGHGGLGWFCPWYQGNGASPLGTGFPAPGVGSVCG